MKQGGWLWAMGFLLMAALSAGPAAGQTNITTNAEEVLSQAYRAVVDAELARWESRTAEAIAAYQNALALYGRLQTQYPGWQGDAISYRMGECTRAIAELEPLNNPDHAPGAADAKPDMTNTAARLERLVQELRSAQLGLTAGADSTAGRTELVALTRELNRVRAERDQAVRAHQSLLRKQNARTAGAATAADAVRTNVPPKLVPATIKSEARRMMEAGDDRGAMVLLHEAAGLFPGDADLDILQGVAACRAGQFDDAVTILKPFDTRGFTNADALVTLGTAYMGLGRVGEARVATEKALKAKARSPEANYNMAQILLMVTPQEPQAAQAYYQNALALGLPPDADLENSLRIAQIMAKLKKRPK